MSDIENQQEPFDINNLKIESNEYLSRRRVEMLFGTRGEVMIRALVYWSDCLDKIPSFFGKNILLCEEDSRRMFKLFDMVYPEKVE